MSGQRDFEGKDLAEALRAASERLGIPEPDLDYKILEQGRRGLFGVGARNVRIRVMPPVAQIPDHALHRDDDELAGSLPPRSPAADRGGRPQRAGRGGGEAAETSDGARGGERRGGRGRGGRGRRRAGERRGTAGDEHRRAAGEERRPEGGGEQRGAAAADRRGGGDGNERRDERAPAAERGGGRGRGRGRGSRGGGRRGGRGNGQPRRTDQRASATVADTPPVVHDDAPPIDETVRRMLSLMDFDIDVAATHEDGEATIELAGPDVALLSSKEADGIQAMQFLLNRMAKRSWPDIDRVVVFSADADADSRSRDDDLVALTHETARQVIETGRPQRLQPMNAYERRLVHLTVREYDELGSRSEGDSHLKRVRIFRQAEGRPADGRG